MLQSKDCNSWDSVYLQHCINDFYTWLVLHKAERRFNSHDSSQNECEIILFLISFKRSSSSILHWKVNVYKAIETESVSVYKLHQVFYFLCRDSSLKPRNFLWLAWPDRVTPYSKLHCVLCLLHVSVREVRRTQILIDSENRSADCNMFFALESCSLSVESFAIKLTKER